MSTQPEKESSRPPSRRERSSGRDGKLRPESPLRAADHLSGSTSNPASTPSTPGGGDEFFQAVEDPSLLPATPPGTKPPPPKFQRKHESRDARLSRAVHSSRDPRVARSHSLVLERGASRSPSASTRAHPYADGTRTSRAAAPPQAAHADRAPTAPTEAAQSKQPASQALGRAHTYGQEMRKSQQQPKNDRSMSPPLGEDKKFSATKKSLSHAELIEYVKRQSRGEPAAIAEPPALAPACTGPPTYTGPPALAVQTVAIQATYATPPPFAGPSTCVERPAQILPPALYGQPAQTGPIITIAGTSTYVVQSKQTGPLMYYGQPVLTEQPAPSAAPRTQPPPEHVPLQTPAARRWEANSLTTPPGGFGPPQPQDACSAPQTRSPATSHPEAQPKLGKRPAVSPLEMPPRPRAIIISPQQQRPYCPPFGQPARHLSPSSQEEEKEGKAMDLDPNLAGPPPPPSQPSSSYAAAARSEATLKDATRPPPHTHADPIQEGQNNQNGAPTQTEKKTRYPPLVVEYLPDWAIHFRRLKESLGHAPNARPYGRGVRFTPRADTEYRTIQRYLSQLEQESGLSWFSYSLPAERAVKVAIRGLPVETDPEAICEELRERGFEPEFARPIKARDGRPGCIFFAQLQRTPRTVPDIYNTTELLCMPGVKVEAWRGKKGPAQCHRCQQFRHSSHNCHRKPACVRCGEDHLARDCPRSKDEPPTCANCGGAHTSNNILCPIFQREMRNKRAGTVAITAAPRRPPQEKSGPQSSTHQEPNAATSLMAAANPPQQSGKQPPAGRRKRRRRRKRVSKTEKPNLASEVPSRRPAPPTETPADAAPARPIAAPRRKAYLERKTQTTPSQSQGGGTNELVKEMLIIFSELMVAVMSGENPMMAIQEALNKLMASYG